MTWVKIIIFKIRYGGNAEKFMRKLLISFGGAGALHINYLLCKIAQ
jgi:hypothetical protein